METTEIRKKLKAELGYNARQVSVKSSPCTYSSALTFTIRDAKVDYNKVEEFSDKFKDISRCQASGEILNGGNTYVDVRITSEVAAIWAQKYLPQLEAVKDKINADTGTTVGIYCLFLERQGGTLVKVWKEGQSWIRWNYQLCDLKSLATDMYIEDKKAA